MTQIELYNWENYKRSKWWYIIFVTFFVLVIFVSLLLQNWQWALFIMFMLGGYILFGLLNTQKIKVSIDDKWLKINEKFYPKSEIRWFCLELDSETQIIKNIVFFIKTNKMIHSFVDVRDPEVKDFLKKLSKQAPMISEYEQSFVDRLIRFLKL